MLKRIACLHCSLRQSNTQSYHHAAAMFACMLSAILLLLTVGGGTTPAMPEPAANQAWLVAAMNWRMLVYLLSHACQAARLLTAWASLAATMLIVDSVHWTPNPPSRHGLVHLPPCGNICTSTKGCELNTLSCAGECSAFCLGVSHSSHTMCRRLAELAALKG